MAWHGMLPANLGSGLCAVTSPCLHSMSQDLESILNGFWKASVHLGPWLALASPPIPVREDDRARSQSLMPCLLTAGPEHRDCKCRRVFCPAVPAPSQGGRSACPALLLAVAVLPLHPALPLPLPKGLRGPVCLGLRSPPTEAAGKPLLGALGPGMLSKLAASAQSCWDGRQPRQACRAKIKPESLCHARGAVCWVPTGD